MIKKSVISLISYDAEYLPNSIKSYYEYVDEIVLGLDKNRVSWSKNKFSFDEQKLWKDLSTIDTDGCLWNCRWGGSCIVRFTPNGKIDQFIESNLANPFSDIPELEFMVLKFLIVYFHN